MTNFLILKGICKDFGGLRALDKVDLIIEEGQIKGLIGPNGAGKTTLFNVITGFYMPTEGEIVFEDQPITRMADYQMAKLGVVRTFQISKLFKEVTVLENVMAGRHLKTKASLPQILTRSRFFRAEEKETRDYAMDLIKFVGLENCSFEKASVLSCGQQRLVEIARALAAEPKLLLLDEPTAGLNPGETKELMELILTLHEKGTTIFLIEHNMSMVMDISQQISVLDFGRKIAEGTPEEIAKNPIVIKAYLGKEYGTA